MIIDWIVKKGMHRKGRKKKCRRIKRSKKIDRKKKYRMMKTPKDSYVEKNVENVSIRNSDYSNVNNFITT
jgi:hypothetical protein